MKLIAELLAEADEEDITAGVEKLAASAKKGFEKAKDNHKKKEAELKDAEKAAEQAKKDAAKKIEDAKKKEENAKKYAKKEAEQAGKEAEADHKLQSAEAMASLKDDLDDFIDAFFTSFPLQKDADVAELLKKYPTLEAAKAAFEAFKGFSLRLRELRVGFNSSLVKSRKVKQEAVDRYNQLIKPYAAEGATPNFDREFIAFVKGEAKFFKRLVTVKDGFKLNDTQFKELMALKVQQTAPERIPDAAEYINILMAYASAKFKAHALKIGAVGSNLHDQKAASEKEMRRRAAAAKAAANPDPVPEALNHLKELLG